MKKLFAGMLFIAILASSSVAPAQESAQPAAIPGSGPIITIGLQSLPPEQALELARTLFQANGAAVGPRMISVRVPNDETAKELQNQLNELDQRETERLDLEKAMDADREAARRDELAKKVAIRRATEWEVGEFEKKYNGLKEMKQPGQSQVQSLLTEGQELSRKALDVLSFDHWMMPQHEVRVRHLEAMMKEMQRGDPATDVANTQRYLDTLSMENQLRQQEEWTSAMREQRILNGDVPGTDELKRLLEQVQSLNGELTTAGPRTTQNAEQIENLMSHRAGATRRWEQLHGLRQNWMEAKIAVARARGKAAESATATIRKQREKLEVDRARLMGQGAARDDERIRKLDAEVAELAKKERETIEAAAGNSSEVQYASILEQRARLLAEGAAEDDERVKQLSEQIANLDNARSMAEEERITAEAEELFYLLRKDQIAQAEREKAAQARQELLSAGMALGPEEKAVVLQADLARAQAQLAQQADELARAKQQLAEAQNPQRQEMDKLELERAVMIQRGLGEDHTKIRELQNRIDALRNQLQEEKPFSEQNRPSNSWNAEVRRQLAESQAQLAAQADELAKAKKLLAAAQSPLRLEIARLEAELAVLKQTRGDGHQQVIDLQATIKSLQSQLPAGDAPTNPLVTPVSALVRTRSQIATLQEQIALLETQRRAFQERGMLANADSLNAEIANQEKLIQALNQSLLQMEHPGTTKVTRMGQPDRDGKFTVTYETFLPLGMFVELFNAADPSREYRNITTNWGSKIQVTGNQQVHLEFLELLKKLLKERAQERAVLPVTDMAYEQLTSLLNSLFANEALDRRPVLASSPMAILVYGTVEQLQQVHQTLASMTGPAAPEALQLSKDQISQLHQQFQAAEAAALAQAEQLKAHKGNALENPQAGKLREEVTKAFEARQSQQRAEVETLQQRLRTLQQSVDAREKSKQQIIDRRVQELLNPNLKWETSRRMLDQNSLTTGDLRLITLSRPEKGRAAAVFQRGPANEPLTVEEAKPVTVNDLPMTLVRVEKTSIVLLHDQDLLQWNVGSPTLARLQPLQGVELGRATESISGMWRVPEVEEESLGLGDLDNKRCIIDGLRSAWVDLSKKEVAQAYEYSPDSGRRSEESVWLLALQGPVLGLMRITGDEAELYSFVDQRFREIGHLQRTDRIIPPEVKTLYANIQPQSPEPYFNAPLPQPASKPSTTISDASVLAGIFNDVRSGTAGTIFDREKGKSIHFREGDLIQVNGADMKVHELGETSLVIEKDSRQYRLEIGMPISKMQEIGPSPVDVMVNPAPAAAPPVPVQLAAGPNGLDILALTNQATSFRVTFQELAAEIPNLQGAARQAREQQFAAFKDQYDAMLSLVKLRVAQAQREVEKAQLDLDRMKKLAAAQAATAEEVREKEHGFQEAQGNLEMARQVLDLLGKAAPPEIKLGAISNPQGDINPAGPPSTIPKNGAAPPAGGFHGLWKLQAFAPQLPVKSPEYLIIQPESVAYIAARGPDREVKCLWQGRYVIEGMNVENRPVQALRPIPSDPESRLDIQLIVDDRKQLRVISSQGGNSFLLALYSLVSLPGADTEKVSRALVDGGLKPSSALEHANIWGMVQNPQENHLAPAYAPYPETDSPSNLSSAIGRANSPVTRLAASPNGLDILALTNQATSFRVTFQELAAEIPKLQGTARQAKVQQFEAYKDQYAATLRLVEQQIQQIKGSQLDVAKQRYEQVNLQVQSGMSSQSELVKVQGDLLSAESQLQMAVQVLDLLKRAAPPELPREAASMQPVHPQAAADHAQLKHSQENAKRIMLALHLYHEKHGHFPPAAVMNQAGTVPHSWRVEILPHLGQAEQVLFAEYRLDEPWDSEHNKKLLEKMPDLYRAPGDDLKSVNASYFGLGNPVPGPYYVDKRRVTLFNGASGAKISDAHDGTSNALAVVECKRDIPWTKPEDIHYSSGTLVPKLGGWHEGAFIGGRVDGAALVYSSSNDEATLRKLIEIDDGQPVKPVILEIK